MSIKIKHVPNQPVPSLTSTLKLAPNCHSQSARPAIHSQVVVEPLPEAYPRQKRVSFAAEDMEHNALPSKPHRSLRILRRDRRALPAHRLPYVGSSAKYRRLLKWPMAYLATASLIRGPGRLL